MIKKNVFPGGFFKSAQAFEKKKTYDTTALFIIIVIIIILLISNHATRFELLKFFPPFRGKK